MITLNTNKSVVRLDGWDDFVGRPGFSPDLNPAEHDLDAIIGRYNIGERVRCGLSNCHTPHAKGYLVSTKSGRETNIGKDCGKTYFGVDFENMAKQFERMSIEQENRELLSNFSFNIEDLDNRIHALRQGHRGADWVHKQGRCLAVANPRVPIEVVRIITRMVKSGSNQLTVAREANEAEVEAMEIAQRKKFDRPQYVEDFVSIIEGLDSLFPENDLRKLIILDVEEQLKIFRTLAVDQLTFDQLRYWKKWSVSVDISLDNAESAKNIGNTLLTYPNLCPLLKIPSLAKKADQELFQTYLDALSV